MDRGKIASSAIRMQDVYPVGEGKAEVENSWKGNIELGSILGRNKWQHIRLRLCYSVSEEL